METFDLPAYLNNHHLICCMLVFISSILITLAIIPSIIYVAKTHNLYDNFSYFRKRHLGAIPRLGGVGIYTGFTVTLLFFGLTDKTTPINYLLAACMILSIMGIKDDLLGVNPRTKLIIQLITSLILVIPGNIRISSFHGVFGLYDISYPASVVLSLLVIIFIINSFNLIDGIDGLSAMTGIIVNSVFSALFIYTGKYELATISLAMTGAIIGFIQFNITPAKIFMGDTGALLIGLISAVMAIKFLEVNKFTENSSPYIFSAPAIALAILIIPVSDALRVFILRILKGKSPFLADRNHIHHRILKLGFTHMQATTLLIGVNLLMILIACLFANYGNGFLLIVISVITLMFNWILSYLIRSKERESYALRNLFL